MNRDRPLFQVLGEDGFTRRGPERRGAAQELVQDAAERVDVGLLADRSFRDLLGREVFRERLDGDEALHLPRVAQAGQIDVHQLDAPVVGHHHVTGAERPVDEPHVVERLHGRAEIERQAHRGRDLEWRPARREHLAQTVPFDELRHREGPARFELTELEHAHHARMRVRCRDDRPRHAQNRLRGVRGLDEATREEADRDAVAGRLVLADAHGPERSGAELADNPIATPDAQPDRKVLTTLDGRDCRGVSVHHKSPQTISPIMWASSDVNGTSLNRYRLSIHHDFGGHVKLCGHPTARERRRPGLVSRSEPFGPAEALPSTFFMVG